MKRGKGHVWALALLLVLAGLEISGAQTVGWPDAVGRLAEERTKAEACAALLKGYGSEAQISREQLVYSEAKANIDAVIAGLITALSAGDEPESLTSLEDKLESGALTLRLFCNAVAMLLPDASGEKNFLVDITKGAIEPVIAALSDGIAAIYNNYRGDDALTRQTIQTQLEAARWPMFADVQPAR